MNIKTTFFLTIFLASVSQVSMATIYFKLTYPHGDSSWGESVQVTITAEQAVLSLGEARRSVLQKTLPAGQTLTIPVSGYEALDTQHGIAMALTVKTSMNQRFVGSLQLPSIATSTNSVTSFDLKELTMSEIISTICIEGIGTYQCFGSCSF